jgi:hypothetical protein
MSAELQAAIDALTKRIDSFEKEHRAFHSSRRGVEGARGETGTPGRNGKDSEIPGPQGVPGRDGKDANVGECVAAAQAAMERELAAFRAALSGAIAQELKTAGVVDANGKAILVSGPAGKDSIVPGPPGERGETGAAGQSITGQRGERGERGSDGQSITGPAGRDGASITGPAGRDGVNGKDSEGFTPSEIARMEAKFRVQWKSDLQIALAAHFRESHFEKS